MLHQGSPNVNKDKIHKEYNKIDRFVLIKEPKNEFDIYSDSSLNNLVGKYENLLLESM